MRRALRALAIGAAVAISAAAALWLALMTVTYLALGPLRLVAHLIGA